MPHRDIYTNTLVVVAPFNRDPVSSGPDRAACREGHPRRTNTIDLEQATSDHRSAADQVGAQPVREMFRRFLRIDKRVDQ